MAAVVESAVPELDACAALRADLAAHPGHTSGAAAPNGRGLAPAGDAYRAAGPAPPAPGDAVRAAAWLPLVVGLERAARLPHRARPAHFRRQQAAWDAAAEALADAHYARVGERLARWRAPDPRLRLVKEVLWALEQPEAAGYTRLALAGMNALGELVTTADVRSGYVLAQSARAVRTLGNSLEALNRYIFSEKLGRRFRDKWLCARSAVGLATTHQYLGNYPSARAVFRRVLEQETPDAQFIAAAHHGLLISAMAAQDWDAALGEVWHLLQAGQSGAIPRAEVLNLMAELCYRVGRYEVAARGAEAALQVSFRPDQTITALAVLVDVAAASHDRTLGLRYGPLLRDHIGGAAGPFEDARALLSLAGLEHVLGSSKVANRDLDRARIVAAELHYHELQFKADMMGIAFARNSLDRTKDDRSNMEARLSGHSRSIISQLNGWKEDELLGAVSTTR